MRKLNKRILAVLLVAVLAIGTVMSAWAEDVTESKTYEDGLVVDGSNGWNSTGGDEYYLTDDDVTVVFDNDPFKRDSDNWSNFIFETTATDEAAGITLRADAFGWSYGTNTDNVPSYEVTTSWGDDWDSFATSCVGTVTLVVSKTSDTVVTASFTFADGATEVYTITYPTAVPDSLGFHVGADGGIVTIQSVTYAGEETEDDNTVTGTAEDVTIEGGFSASTGELTLTGDFDLTYTFTNTGDLENSGENWNNYILEMNTPGGVYIDVRADNYGWTANTTDGAALTFGDGAEDWAAWLELMKSGVEVTVNVVRSGNTFTITSTAGEYVFTATITAADFEGQSVSVRLTGEQVALTNVSYSYILIAEEGDEDETTGSSTDDTEEPTTETPAEEEPTTETPAEEEPTTETPAEEETTATATDGTSISYTVTEEVTVSETADDVDITTGFSAHTGEVTISGDFTLEYTFTNTSTGTNNWDNFILEMVADGIYLDVRADNYGWLANADENDTLEFGDGAEDWDVWNAAMAAGSECTVTVVKEGANIYITIVAGGETFTATAYVAEYEDAALTIYLTGENVSLTNVSYTYTYTTTTTKTDTYSEVVEISDVVITIESMSDGVDANAVVNYDVYELSEDEQAALEAIWEGALSYDVLDVYLTVDGELYEIPDGESVQLRISYSCDSSYETALVLHYVDEDGEWHVIVPDEVGDGYILATFTSLSPIALIVGSSESETETETEEDTEEDTTTTSEDEANSSVAGGDISTMVYFVLLFGAAAVCVVLAKKKVTE